MMRVSPRPSPAVIHVVVLLQTLLGGAALALQEEAPPPPAPQPVRVVALGAVEWASETPEGYAVAVAIEEELIRKMALGAPETVRPVPTAALRRAAMALTPPVDVTDWSSSRLAAERLHYDLLILVQGQTVGQTISARWQLHDGADGQGTLGAGQLPGHMVDLDGFVTSLTRRVAEAIGGFDPQRLRTDLRIGVTESNEAYAEYFMGRALLRMGRYTEAAARLTSALANDPELAEARWYLAAASAGTAAELRAAGNHAEAVALAESTLQQVQGTNLYDVQASLLETLEVSYRALGQLPQSQEATLKRAEAVLAQGQSRLALALIERLLDEGFQHPSIPLTLASALRLSEDWDAATRVLEEAIAADPASGPLAYALGDLRLGLSAMAEPGEQRQALAESAVQALQTASALMPDSPEVLARLGEAWLAAGNLGEARAALTQALQAGEGVLSPMARARGLLSLGRIDLAEGNADAARAQLAEAYALGVGVPLVAVPGSPGEPIDYTPAGFWSDLGHAFLDLGDAPLAQSCLREGLIRCGPQAPLPSLEARLAVPAPAPTETVPAEAPPAEGA